MGGMVKDVFDFLMLLILVLLGFAGALTTLFASDLDIEDYPDYDMTEIDSDCLMLMGRNSSFIAVCTAPHAHLRTAADQYSREGGILELSPLALCAVSRSRSPRPTYIIHTACLVYTGVQEPLRGFAARRLTLRGVHLPVCTPGDLSGETSLHTFPSRCWSIPP